MVLSKEVIVMALDKVFQMYPTFDGWVQAHKHSSSSISCALEDALQNQPGDTIEALKSYVDGLNELRSEIRAEVSEAKVLAQVFQEAEKVICVSKMPSVNELYETILSRSSLPLPGIEDALIEKAWKRANQDSPLPGRQGRQTGF